MGGLIGLFPGQPQSPGASTGSANTTFGPSGSATSVFGGQPATGAGNGFGLDPGLLRQLIMKRLAEGEQERALQRQRAAWEFEQTKKMSDLQYQQALQASHAGDLRQGAPPGDPNAGKIPMFTKQLHGLAGSGQVLAQPWEREANFSGYAPEGYNPYPGSSQIVGLGTPTSPGAAPGSFETYKAARDAEYGRGQPQPVQPQQKPPAPQENKTATGGTTASGGKTAGGKP